MKDTPDITMEILDVLLKRKADHESELRSLDDRAKMKFRQLAELEAVIRIISDIIDARDRAADSAINDAVINAVIEQINDTVTATASQRTTEDR